jgi:hypothetical protein
MHAGSIIDSHGVFFVFVLETEEGIRHCLITGSQIMNNNVMHGLDPKLGGCTPEFLSLSERSVRHTHALTSLARYLLLMGDLSLHPLQSME